MKSTVMLSIIGSGVTLALLFEMLRRRQLREKYAVFWAIVATGTLVVAVFPELLSRTSRLLGVAVPSNLLFFVASMVLFVISVQHSSELGRLEERNRTLAEELALVKIRLESLEDHDARREPSETQPETSREAASVTEPRGVQTPVTPS